MTGTRPYSLWNLRNWCLWTAKSGKIAALSRSNMSPKHYITRYKQQNWTLKNCWANKFSKTTIAVCFNLLHICASVLSLLFDMSFIPSFNVLSGYFDGSLNLVAVPIVWVLINFLIQLLKYVVSTNASHISEERLFHVIASSKPIEYFP